MINLYNELKADFEEVEPIAFYRDIFRARQEDRESRKTRTRSQDYDLER